MSIFVVFKKSDTRSGTSQVRASSLWLGSASMPTLPVCHSAALLCSALPGVQGSCKGLGVCEQRRGKDGANKQNAHSKAPLCLILLLSLLLVVQVKAAYSHYPGGGAFPSPLKGASPGRCCWGAS